MKKIPSILPEGIASRCPACGKCLENERIKVKLKDICKFCHSNIERSLVWDNK